MNTEMPKAKFTLQGLLKSRLFKISCSLIVLFAIDFGLRTYESSQLVTNIEASEKSMEAFNADWDRIQKNTNLDRSTFIGQIVTSANDHSRQVFVTGVAVERMTILPWHKKLLTARSDYMRHSNAWYSYLSKTKIKFTDPLTIDWGNEEDISPTFDLLKVTLPKAIPSFDPFHLQSRVTKILLN